MLHNIIALKELIDRALQEDIGAGDVTTNGIVPPGHVVTALISSGKAGVIAGLPVAEAVFCRLSPDIHFYPRVQDGDRVERGQLLASIEGNGRAILTGERVALNFMQRLSGIATYTASLVRMVEKYRAKIVDTRKTTPGLRALEKYAVRAGGGNNHRFGLYDAVLIKDNHLKVAGSIGRAVQLVRAAAPFTMKIEVEVEDLAGVEEALLAGVDIIMLDNMPVATMRHAVEMVAGRALLEASGGVDEQNIVTVAQTGVDLISIGSLTHSVRALDISLELV
jgi:nicotinate-nucleotide pyrophosphorylase (carboxylating)